MVSAPAAGLSAFWRCLRTVLLALLVGRLQRA